MQNVILLCSIASVAVAGTPECQTTHSADEIIVPIQFQPNEGSRPNRAPARIPIRGYVDTAAEIAVITFKSPCGNVTVSFLNTSTGYTADAIVDGTGTVMIPLTCDSGSWMVSFLLESGAEYTGVFVL